MGSVPEVMSTRTVWEYQIIREEMAQRGPNTTAPSSNFGCHSSLNTTYDLPNYPTEMFISQLPEETIIRIFEYLDFRTLIDCSETCRTFRGIIGHSSSLRYNSELEIAGLVDAGRASSLSIAERLKELEVIERNWATLSYRESMMRTFDFLDNCMWELFGGVCSVGAWGGRGLSFTELPSLARETPARSWKHDDLGLNIGDFGMDPSQDLAVLIQASPDPRESQEICSIHLRSMHSGDQHCCATEPIIHCTVRLDPDSSSVIQIMGDFLGILFLPHSPRDWQPCVAHVWNWKTGRTAFRLKPDDPYQRYDSFSFLSTRHILLTSYMPRGISPTLEIYDFMSEAIDSPQPVRIFEFPGIADLVGFSSMLTRSDPSPGHVTSQGGRPFVTAPTARLLTVRVQAFRDIYAVEFFELVLFVHHDSLLGGIESPGPTLVPWEEWGPKKTRLLQMPFNTNSWICYVHGTRAVTMAEEIIHPAEKAHIKLLDFNPSSINRDFKLSEIESRRITIFSDSKPTVIDVNESIFDRTVITSLPYREVVSAEKFGYAAVMIDDECLVGIRPEVFGGPSLEFLSI